MIDPKKQADLDQSATLMAEVLPPLWRKMYVSLLAEGFERAEAMEILKAYILSQSSYGVNGTR